MLAKMAGLSARMTIDEDGGLVTVHGKVMARERREWESMNMAGVLLCMAKMARKRRE